MIDNVIVKGCPVSTGHIESNGWVWSYPAIARVAGTAGNLEKWVTGFKTVWEDRLDPSKTEESFRWGKPTTPKMAWEWFES